MAVYRVVEWMVLIHFLCSMTCVFALTGPADRCTHVSLHCLGFCVVPSDKGLVCSLCLVLVQEANVYPYYAELIGAYGGVPICSSIHNLNVVGVNNESPFNIVVGPLSKFSELGVFIYTVIIRES